jgi:flagellar biosynthesis protein FlhA
MTTETDVAATAARKARSSTLPARARVGRAEPILLAGAAGVVCLLVVPMPTWAIDALLAAQLGGSVVMLLAVLGAATPLRLSVFPTVLVLATLVRLGLNVSTTRLVLTDANAGAVVAAFGDVVVAGNLLVGAVIFGVITIVMYLVIARGAERVAQVAARFALDALPGHQLAIDADLRADRIDAESARLRRARLVAESNLYGAMDGAMKFVRGDAIAGLCIVAVNGLGGLAVGVVQRGMPAEEALSVFTVLTIGDGLASQVPALLSTAAAALLVTRVATGADETPGRAITTQMLADGRGAMAAGGLLALLGLVPGLPLLPLVAVGAFLVAVGVSAAGAAAPPVRPPATPPLTLHHHPGLERDLGAGALADRIAEVRRRLWADLGVRLPEVRLVADPALPAGGFVAGAHGRPLGRGRVVAGHVFVRGRPDPAGVDPLTGGPGAWLPHPTGDAESLTPTDYLEAHLATSWLRDPRALVPLRAVAEALAEAERSDPALVRAVVPARASVAQLATLLRALVAEGVRIRDLGVVLEALAEQPVGTAAPDQLAGARRALPVAAPEDGILRAIALDAATTRALGGKPNLELEEALVDGARIALERAPDAALVVPPEIRSAVRSAVGRALPGLPVLAQDEIPSGCTIRMIAMLSA